MGELLVGRPVMRQLVAVSAPLVMTSAISMTYRAVDRGDDRTSLAVDRWFFDARERLSPEIQHDLDLLLGFSGRLLYYAEELLFSFDVLEPDRLDATYEDYYEHLASLPAVAFQRMAANAVRRVYRDRGVVEMPPESDDLDEWRMFLRPSIAGADLNEIAELITRPEELRQRTLNLIDSFWRTCYAEEYHRQLPDLQRAVRYAQSLAHPVVQVTFSELTGHRLPDDIAAHLADVERVTYCPSSHLGDFIQFIFYPPELILFFNPQTVLNAGRAPAMTFEAGAEMGEHEALAGLKAVADPTRLKILMMLRDREHYAQEIVGKLGISQSAVSRHLATLESANVLQVRPHQGMKYYAIDSERLEALAGYIHGLASTDES